jgi:hypothetical protein
MPAAGGREAALARGSNTGGSRLVSSPIFYTIVASLLALAAAPAGRAVLTSAAALAPHVTGQFREPDGFAQLASGEFVVADRRGHTVYVVAPDMASARPVIRIGQEPGNILLPFGFDVDRAGNLIVVGDSPGPFDRIQVFTPAGSRVAGFSLPGRGGALLRMDGVAMNGAASLRATSAHTVLVSQPETGSLITEYDYYGRLVRSVGTLRRTGHEDDRPLHLALNAGLPLPAPDGGYYFVSRAGEPRIRRFDASGALRYERVIQGPELDALRRAEPTAWPRDAAHGNIPLVTSLVRTAAVDPAGRLWVGLSVPYVYVYDDAGEKERTLQLRGAGIITPTSLDFSGDGRLMATPGCYFFRPE